MKRTRAWRRHQDQRHIDRWMTYRDTFIEPEWWGEYWTQRGRFRKFTMSCDCSVCLVDREARKYRRHGRRKHWREVALWN